MGGLRAAIPKLSRGLQAIRMTDLAEVRGPGR